MGLALKRLNSEMRTLRSKRIKGFFFLFMLVSSFSLFGQDTILVKQDSVKELDVTDILKKILNKSGKPKPEADPTKLHFAILPTLSYNPSFGFIFGGKLTGGKQIGDPANTDLSVYALEAFMVRKEKVPSPQNITFSAGKKWNWGQWQLAKYGLLIISTEIQNQNGGFLRSVPIKNADSSFQ
jgi:hypothetical protein